MPHRVAHMEAICDWSPHRSPPSQTERPNPRYSQVPLFFPPHAMTAFQLLDSLWSGWRFARWAPVGRVRDQSWALMSSSSLMKRPRCYELAAPNLLERSPRSQWSAICIKMLTWLDVRRGHAGEPLLYCVQDRGDDSSHSWGRKSVWIVWPKARVRSRPARASPRGEQRGSQRRNLPYSLRESCGPRWLTGTGSQNFCGHMSDTSHCSANEICWCKRSGCLFTIELTACH